MVGVNLYWDYALPESADTVVIAMEDPEEEVALEQLLHIYFPDFWCALNASLLSTVVEVRPVHAAFSHRQQRNALDTLIHWQVSYTRYLGFKRKSYWKYRRSRLSMQRSK